MNSSLSAWCIVSIAKAVYFYEATEEISATNPVLLLRPMRGNQPPFVNSVPESPSLLTVWLV
jgi:hypothetical protein